MKYHGSPKFDYLNGKNKSVEISLNDAKSLTDAISKYIGSKADIVNAAAEAVEKLCEEGERSAKWYCPYDTGELQESITHKTDVIGDTVIGTITAGTDHAMFVEFGTGVVGNGTYPGDSSGWMYDMWGHGEKGWKYPKKDGTFGWTRGLPSRHMFYDAFQDIQKEIGDIVQVEIQKTVGDIYGDR